MTDSQVSLQSVLERCDLIRSEFERCMRLGLQFPSLNDLDQRLGRSNCRSNLIKKWKAHRADLTKTLSEISAVYEDVFSSATEKDRCAIEYRELTEAVKKVREDQRKSEAVRNIQKQWTPEALP